MALKGKPTAADAGNRTREEGMTTTTDTQDQPVDLIEWLYEDALIIQAYEDHWDQNEDIDEDLLLEMNPAELDRIRQQPNLEQWLNRRLERLTFQTEPPTQGSTYDGTRAGRPALEDSPGRPPGHRTDTGRIET